MADDLHGSTDAGDVAPKSDTHALERFFLTEGKTAPPWWYTRARLAEAWCTQPWEVERIRTEAPYEITRQLAMWRIEQKARATLEKLHESLKR